MAFSRAEVASSLEGRRAALLEIAAIMAGIFAYLWLVVPTGRPLPTIAGALAILAAITASIVLRMQGAGDCGLGCGNFRGSALEVGTFTMACGAGLLAASAVLDSRPELDYPVWAILITYTGWGFLQQYIFQSYLNNRLRAVVRGNLRGILLNAAIFSSVHLPNSFLMAMTFVGGLFWSYSFRRHPNLITVSISHGVLGTMLYYALPRSVTHGLAIGPGYP